MIVAFRKCACNFWRNAWRNTAPLYLEELGYATWQLMEASRPAQQLPALPGELYLISLLRSIGMSIDCPAHLR